MQNEQEGRVIIPTLAYQTLSSTVELVCRTARLGIVKGAVGIGKTFALRHISADLMAQGVKVVKHRVPLARKWLILMLVWQGWSHAQIARTVRTSDNTVRRYVKETAE